MDVLPCPFGNHEDPFCPACGGDGQVYADVYNQYMALIDHQTRNLESGHTASGLNEHDLREPAGDWRTQEQIDEATKLGEMMAEREAELAYFNCPACDNGFDETGYIKCRLCNGTQHVEPPHYYTGEDDVPCKGCGEHVMLNKEGYCIRCWDDETIVSAETYARAIVEPREIVPCPVCGATESIIYGGVCVGCDFDKALGNDRVWVDGQVILDALPSLPASAADCMDFDSEYDRLFCACGNPYGEGGRCRYCDGKGE